MLRFLIWLIISFFKLIIFMCLSLTALFLLLGRMMK